MAASGSGFFRRKNDTRKRLVYFEIYFGSQTTYARLIMIHFKINTMIFILISWNSRGKILLMPRFLDLDVEIHDRKFTTNLFDKADAFSF